MDPGSRIKECRVMIESELRRPKLEQSTDLLEFLKADIAEAKLKLEVAEAKLKLEVVLAEYKQELAKPPSERSADVLLFLEKQLPAG